MPRASIDGVTLAWEAAGEGPAMVLLHPNPFDHAIWQYQMARFSYWFHVIAPDFPGYGRSARVAWPSISAVSDGVAGLLDHLGVGQAIVVGLSVGGIVAQEFAVDHPDRVRGLVAAGCSAAGEESGRIMDARIEGYGTRDLAEYYLGHMHELTAPDFPATRLGAHLIGTFHERASTLRREAIVSIYRAIKAWSVKDRLPGLRVPTLYLAGEHDLARATTEAASRLVPGAVFHEIPGAGHACCLERPDEFDRRVLDFLRAHALLPAPNR